MKRVYDVAAYIWPAYTGDEPRTRIFWPEGIGEWETVRKTGRRYGNDTWPRRPLWGYVNEADPYVMEMEIEAASDHGVNVFIYDWYWYDQRPFLEQCLNNGYLKARNNRKVNFYLMWANHNAMNLWDLRNSADLSTMIWNGSVDMGEFKKIGQRLIEKYFALPNYYRIDGKPVFMIYNHKNLVTGLGGEDQTAEAFVWLNRACEEAGLGGIHLQLTLGRELLEAPLRDTLPKLGYQSATHYQFTGITDINRDYEEILKSTGEVWQKIEAEFPLPYCPHISVGWDTNPRFQEFHGGVTKNATPEAFEKGLRMAKDYMDRHPESPLAVINSWNEWTESSYLQPDSRYGYAYLEAVKRVFCAQEEEGK